MSVICRQFLLKLALRPQTFLKRSHASTLSIWTKETKAKSEEEPCKQQFTVTLSDYKNLADTEQFFGKYKNLYVTVPSLLCFILYLRALSNFKPPGTYIRKGDLMEGFVRYEFEGLIHGGAYFRHFTVYWGTTEMQTNIALETPGAQPLVHFRKGKRDIKKRFYRYKRNRRQIKDYDRQLFRSLRACKLAAVLALKMAAKRARMVVFFFCFFFVF